MRNVGLKLFILLIYCIAIPSISFSDSIPMKYQGFWSGKSCDFSIEKYALFIGKNGYLYEDDTKVEFNFVSPEEKDGWTLLSTKDKNYDFYFFYKIENNQLIERYTPDNWDGVDFSFLSNQETQDTIYFKCDKKDPTIESKYGELLTLLDSPAVGSCQQSGRDSCLKSLFSFLDVNKDKKLHAAELNRGLRALSLLSVLLSQNTNDDIDKNASFGIYFATVPFLPLLTQTFIYNIDYDGSGSLTLEEISQDRGDLFSAVVNAKDAVLKDIRSLPDFFKNLAPLIQGLNNLN